MESQNTSEIIVIVAAILGVLVPLIIWSVNKLDNDIKSMNTRLDGHAQRIDQIYSVILQMLKDRK